MDMQVVNLEDLKAKLSATQGRILDLLGAGISPVQVAQACGVTEGYVSSLLAQEEFAALVTQMRVERSGKFVKHDETIEEVEAKALEKVKNLLPLVTRPMEAIRIFQTLNQARRKTDPTSNLPSSPGGGVVVHLELPESANVHFKMTVDKQVIEVEGRSMVPLPAAQVSKMLKDKQTKDLLESTKVVESLPSNPLLDEI